jgi:hypothetical protein
MRQLKSYADDRLVASCIYCGAETKTREHCPSRIFLDEPYPENLPIVPSCAECNKGFSLDEEYFACLIECARVGSVEAVERPKIRGALAHSAGLVARLKMSFHVAADGQPTIDIQQDRVKRIVSKLARGHAAFELSEVVRTEPSRLVFFPIHLMASYDREEFETAPASPVWPEVGSRAMQRMLVSGDAPLGPGWIEIQRGRYRYLPVADGDITIRIVISDYLACELIWTDR